MGREERAGQQLVDILPGDQSLKLTGRQGRGIGGDAGVKREETGAPRFLFVSVGPLLLMCLFLSDRPLRGISSGIEALVAPLPSRGFKSTKEQISDSRGPFVDALCRGSGWPLNFFS